MTDDQTAIALGFERTDPIQIHTQIRTITAVVYQCNHREPKFSCRGPEPGERTLCVITAYNDRYRLQYTYYDEFDYTDTTLDQYEYTSDNQYSWLRTGAFVEAITDPKVGEQS